MLLFRICLDRQAGIQHTAVIGLDITVDRRSRQLDLIGQLGGISQNNLKTVLIPEGQLAHILYVNREYRPP